MKPLADYRFGIGPMSKNVVDACIEFANKRDVGVLLIPSRRQVEWDGGYANRWTTQAFSDYVRTRADSRVLLMRDHAGPGQGEHMDDGTLSLKHDCDHFDLIHIDPWKTTPGFRDGCRKTKELIEYCYRLNPTLRFEVGTEEAIFPYDADQLYDLMAFLRVWLPFKAFSQISHAVIQSGTSLKGNTNTGTYDQSRLKDMLAVCAKYGVLSKVHNGDYLPLPLVREMFGLGVNAVNIAPEFGQIETQTYLEAIKGDPILLDTFYCICYDSGKWCKWVTDPNNPPSPIKLINICGHYVISHPDFITKVKAHLGPDIDEKVKAALTLKLTQLYGTI